MNEELVLLDREYTNQFWVCLLQYLNYTVKNVGNSNRDAFINEFNRIINELATFRDRLNESRKGE